MKDFGDEISGYNNNAQIIKNLKALNLKECIENIADNMILCYLKLIELQLVEDSEIILLNAWLNDIHLMG